ncbi:MAG: HEAT repeat domain-containing protein [Planctomycetia bacterium]
MPAPRTLHRAVRLVACGGLLLGGCASSQPWKPFEDPAAVAREREQYGATADERIGTLVEDGKRAKAGSAQQQDEFTQSLATALLAEHDPRVRCKILEIAADFDTAPAAAICRGALQDPEARVRMAACSAWAKRGGPEAVQLLGARYQTDSEIDVRLRALRELGTLGDKEAIPVLARALEDADPAVQYRAVAALKKVSGRDLGNDVNRWREWAADPEGTAAEWSVAEAFRRLW